jgi:hypothetical protein
VRSFDLKVYYYDHTGEVHGSHAPGDAVFLCKPDADGNYPMWRREDRSQTQGVFTASKGGYFRYGNNHPAKWLYFTAG